MFEKASKLDFAPAMYNRAFLLFKMSWDSSESEEFLFDSIHLLRVCLDNCDYIPDAHFLMGYYYEKGI